MRRSALLLGLLAIGGCASLSENECRTADWEQIGYGDGARGAARSRRGAHAEACAGYGIALDVQAWEAGYERGLDNYCTPLNALQVGLAGGDYNGVCPPESDFAFSSHWRAARGVHDQRQRVSELDGRRRSFEYALDEARTDEERRSIRVELSRLDDELRRERDRLLYEEARLNEFARGIR
jgi:hypothetical protein